MIQSRKYISNNLCLGLQLSSVGLSAMKVAFCNTFSLNMFILSLSKLVPNQNISVRRCCSSWKKYTFNVLSIVLRTTIIQPTELYLLALIIDCMGYESCILLVSIHVSSMFWLYNGHCTYAELNYVPSLLIDGIFNRYVFLVLFGMAKLNILSAILEKNENIMKIAIENE